MDERDYKAMNKQNSGSDTILRHLFVLAVLVTLLTIIVIYLPKYLICGGCFYVGWFGKMWYDDFIK